MGMKIQITNINSDRQNILRFVSTIFKNTCILSKLKGNTKLHTDYQKFSNQYKSQLRKLLNIIKSDSDYRINEVTTQLNELINYFNGATDVIRVTTSDIVINDILRVLVQFIETKFSDLLKIDII